MAYIIASAPSQTTGLSPTITIAKLSDGSVVVNAQAMSASSIAGNYKYVFSAVDDVDYEYVVDFGSTVGGPGRYSSNTFSATNTDAPTVQEIWEYNNRTLSFYPNFAMPPEIWAEEIAKRLTGKKLKPEDRKEYDEIAKALKAIKEAVEKEEPVNDDNELKDALGSLKDSLEQVKSKVKDVKNDTALVPLVLAHTVKK